MRDSFEGFVRHFLHAVQLATRLPVKSGAAPDDPQVLRASAAHAPGAGWLVGMAACVSFAVVSLGLPDEALTPMAAAVACIIATMLLTGAAHERSVTHLTGGNLAITMLLMAKVALVSVLAARSPGAVLTAILAAHTVSRFWPLVLIHTLAPAHGPIDIISQPMADEVNRRSLGVAAAWCIVPLALMALAHGMLFVLLAAVASGLALWALRQWMHRSGGYTSDSLGAAQQACEVAFYLGAGFGLPGR